MTVSEIVSHNKLQMVMEENVTRGNSVALQCVLMEQKKVNIKRVPWIYLLLNFFCWQYCIITLHFGACLIFFFGTLIDISVCSVYQIIN